MEIPHRKRTRLDGFDYSTPGCYFITINAKVRWPWFGTVSNGELLQNDARTMVRRVWETLPDRFAGVLTQDIVVMPDHVHGIVVLGSDPSIPAQHNLSSIMGAFKSITTLNMDAALKNSAGERTMGSFGIEVIATA